MMATSVRFETIGAENQAETAWRAARSAREGRETVAREREEEQKKGEGRAGWTEMEAMAGCFT